ncbi:MAG: hypothetical protein IJH64_01625 [Oscillospiraceae bacterium]|nr:hypothetical protein [Oscillospiraceae bacterium]
MTRTQLISVCNRIIRNHLDMYADSSKKGIIYTGLYRKRTISVFADTSDIVLACTYNGVCYHISQVDLRMSARIRYYALDRNTKTNVFLYKTAKYLYSDNYGHETRAEDMSISKHMDYADVIPIPYDS